MREKRLSHEEIFNGVLLHVWRDRVELPGGRQSIREYITHPGASVMVPLFENGQTILIHQFRYPVGKIMLELPAGKIDAGESPESTVFRELEEETGWKASKIDFLGMMHPCIGYSNERIYAFLVRNLEKSMQNTDHDEIIQPVNLPFKEAVEMCFSGEITDAKTIVALLWAERFLRE